MLFPALLTLLIYGSCGSPLLQPSVAVVALNGTVLFSCRTPAAVRRWLVYDNGSTAPFFWPFDEGPLLTRGIGVTNSSTASDLLVSGNAINNGTTVACVDSSDAASEKALLQVYGRPSAPTELRLAVIGDRHLRLRWNASFIPYQVKVSYVVIVSLNAEEVFRSNRTYDDNYDYFHSFGSECQNYRFSVIAENDAGASEPGESLVSTIPIVPQFTTSTLPMATLIQDHGYSLHISVEAAHACSVSPVSNYYLRLQNARTHSSISVAFPPTRNGSYVEFLVSTADGLEPNTLYVYAITGVNMVGNSTAPAQTLYTTDVQSSTITGSDHQLNVTCSFAEGSLAKGCVVLLERSGEVVQQMISRVNSTAEGVIKTQFSVGCYNISVVDWEEDDSIGLQGVPFSGYRSKVCSIMAIKGMLVATRVPLLVAIVAGLLGAVIGLVVLALIVVLTCCHLHRRKEGSKRCSERNSHSPHSLINNRDHGHKGSLFPPTVFLHPNGGHQAKVSTTPTHSTTSSIEVAADASSLLQASQPVIHSTHLSMQ